MRTLVSLLQMEGGFNCAVVSHLVLVLILE